MPAKKPSKSPRIPPNNIDAERIVLGSVLIDPAAITKVADLLIPEDFYNPSNGQIYKAILNLHVKNQPIDVLSVGNYLKEKKTLKDVGGSSYLAELTSEVTSASHADHYAKIVKEKKILRDLIRASSEISETAFAPSDDVEEMLDTIEQKIMKISQRSLTQSFSHIKDELSEAYERIEKLNALGDGMRGIPTGFQGLDKKLSGLQKSDLVILGARPSLGKTTLALDIARNAAVGHKASVGIFSIEMAKEQVIDRIIAAESRVSLWKLRTGHVKEDVDFQMIQGALDRLSGAKIFIDDSAAPNILQMRSMARRLQMEHGLDLIVVDYLQLISPRTKSDNMVQQVTEISRGLKSLARELQVPVLALSQLSRDVDKRDNRTPKLSDLRESGSIEQDADVVMFISRDNRDNPNLPPEQQGMIKLIIAKHRNGPIGQIDLKFDSDRVSFSSVETRFDEAEVPEF